MNKEAMKLMLEAMEQAHDASLDENHFECRQILMGQITVVREALAEQPAQQEPVALFKWLPEGATHIGRISVRTTAGGSLAMTTHAFKYEEAVLKVYITDNDNEYPGWRDAKDCFFHLNFPVLPLYTTPPAQRTRVGLTEREVELIDGMIEVQLHHAAQCDHMANRTMADKQKGWDMERVELLRKLKENT
jgi:hypothetical protein